MVTLIVAVAVLQFTVALLQISYTIVCTCLLACSTTVKFPSLSILNGPFVTGVTSVCCSCWLRLKVSFVVTFPPVDGNVCYCYTMDLLTTTVSVAVVQFDGLTLTPVVVSDSQMVYVTV
jgi:hypothetical protein